MSMAIIEVIAIIIISISVAFLQKEIRFINSFVNFPAFLIIKGGHLSQILDLSQ